jgi:hypothetical protein
LTLIETHLLWLRTIVWSPCKDGDGDGLSSSSPSWHGMALGEERLWSRYGSC